MFPRLRNIYNNGIIVGLVLPTTDLIDEDIPSAYEEIEKQWKRILFCEECGLIFNYTGDVASNLGLTNLLNEFTCDEKVFILNNNLTVVIDIELTV